MMNLTFIANTIGILSLITAIASIYPSLVNILKTNTKREQLKSNIYQLGLLSTISLGLIHGLLMTQRTNIDFYNLNTYWIYAGGVFLFNLFVFLAFAFPQLKTDLKKLNFFNYAILLLLVCHVGQRIIF